MKQQVVYLQSNTSVWPHKCRTCGGDMLCTKKEESIRSIMLMTNRIWAEFWLIQSSCWCCTWLPMAFCAMGSLKWVPGLPNTNQALGACCLTLSLGSPREAGTTLCRWGTGTKSHEQDSGCTAGITEHEPTQRNSCKSSVTGGMSALNPFSITEKSLFRSTAGTKILPRWGLLPPPGYIITSPAVSIAGDTVSWKHC